MKPITLIIKVYGGEDNYLLVDNLHYYDDIDMMELSNDSLSYKIANIAREEIEKIKKDKFLVENPELYSDKVIISSEPE